MNSPSKASYGDRFIPTRVGARWHINFDSPNLEKEAAQRTSASQNRKTKIVNSNEGTVLVSSLVSSSLLHHWAIHGVTSS